MQSGSPKRKEKHLVLVGGGHAHIEVLRRWAMQPLAKVRLTLISPRADALYSGMIPAFVAGDIQWQDLAIDLYALAKAAGAVFIRSTVTRIDAKTKCIELEDRPGLEYDVLSVNIGSNAQMLPGIDTLVSILRTRPLVAIEKSLRRWDELLQCRPSSIKLCGIGAGPAGVEILAALLARAKKKGYRGTIESKLFDSALALPKARANALLPLGIRFLGDHRADSFAEASEGSVMIRFPHSEERSDFVVLATGARPPMLFANSGLANERGYLAVNKKLEAIQAQNIFGAGDAIDFTRDVRLEKAGVFAVREGPVLFRNLVAALEGGSGEEYRPQRRYLRLLNLSQGEAILEYGPLRWRSSWALRWKRVIDRRFMERYRLPALPPEPEPECQACGGKVASDALAAALPSEHKNEDVVQLTVEGVSLAWNIEHFNGEGFEPFVFGRIIAAHALSDLFAKGTRPLGTLANIVVPRARARIAKDDLRHVLAGVNAVLTEVGLPNVLGGQSTEGDSLSGGLSVLGSGRALWPKRGVQPGDVLLQTHALGTGVLLAAAMRGKLSGEEFYALCDRLGQTKHNISEVLKRFPVHAATDITGFGLAGHLSEMLDNQDFSCEFDKLAVLPRAAELLVEGYQSRMQTENERAFHKFLTKLPPIAFDPQTNGGFLIALPASVMEQCLHALRPLAPEARCIAKVL